MVGAVGIGIGVLRHGKLAPLGIAAVGLTAMGGALVVSHGPREAALTIVGVLLVGSAHILNLRHAH